MRNARMSTHPHTGIRHSTTSAGAHDHSVLASDLIWFFLVALIVVGVFSIR